MIKTIEAGYKAFNGYIFSQKDADYMNNAYFANENERHNTFCIVIGLI